MRITNPTSRRTILMAIGLAGIASSGCQEFRLRERTDRLSGSVTDLYYKQTLNNLAMMHADPGRLPYFGLPSQGTATIQNALQATYTPNWDFITASGRFFASYFNDKNTAAFQGSTQTTETWQTSPTTTPEKLALLRYAYAKTLGRSDYQSDSILAQFDNRYSSPFRFLDALHPGWYCIGRKRDVPKCASYVGRYGDTYVWVMPERSSDLSSFVLAVLDIATAAPKQGETFFSNPAGAQGAQDEVGKQLAELREKVNTLLAKFQKENDAGSQQELNRLFVPFEARGISSNVNSGLDQTQSLLDNLNSSTLNDSTKVGIRTEILDLKDSLLRLQQSQQERTTAPSIIAPRTNDYTLPFAPPYPPPPIP